jgi:glucokinase
MQTKDKVHTNNIDLVIKSKLPAIGIDLGGTKILAAVVNDERVISEPIRISTPTGPENIIASILDLVEQCRKDFTLAGIGISTAGAVNSITGEIVGSTGNLPGWTGTPLKTIIENKTLLPTHVENDGNCAAYGEARARNLRDKACVIVLTIGTGIGGGILINGELFRGDHFAAGECGHIRISLDNKRMCTCGLFDCWEAYGSGRGLLATGKEVLTGVLWHQTPLAKNIDGLTNEAILQAAQQNDLVAQKIIKIWHEHICAGMSSLAHVLDPDCFILTGGLSRFIDFELLSEMFLDKTMPRIAENLEIHKSKLDNLASLMGAAQLVIDNVTANTAS